MRPVEYVNVRENGFEHEEDTSNRSDGHLFAGSACNDEFTRGKEQCSSFGLVDADGDGSEAFFVICAIGNAAGDHVEVDFIMVSVNVNGGDHIVCGGGGVVFVGAKFLADVFVVETVEEACETVIFG